jgi:hypothetical protein
MANLTQATTDAHLHRSASHRLYGFARTQMAKSQAFLLIGSPPTNHENSVIEMARSGGIALSFG